MHASNGKKYRVNDKFSESGIALPMAMLMVVLIGVMGAGLLVFVNTDLTSVVESNQGQRAFEMADAGVKVAKQQLGSESSSTKYDGGSDDSPWSLCFNKTPTACPTSPAAGVTIDNLDGILVTEDSVKVTIQSIGESNFKVLSTGQYGVTKRRIEAIYQFGSNSASSSGALPQLVFARSNIVGDRVGIDGSISPSSGMTMYTRSNVTFEQPDVTLKNASVFSGGNITLNIQNSKNFVVNGNGPYSIDNRCSQQEYFKATGTDPYGDWNKPPNSRFRTTILSGMGAAGDIKDQQSDRRKPCGWGIQFFDRNTDLYPFPTYPSGVVAPSPKLEFVDTLTNPTNQITYPFDKNLMDNDVDPGPGTITRFQKLVNDLKTQSKAQLRTYTVPNGMSTGDLTGSSVGNYIEIKAGGTQNVYFCNQLVPCGTNNLTLNWPEVAANTPAAQWPVIYVKFVSNNSNNKVDWRVQDSPSYSGDDPVERCATGRETALTDSNPKTDLRKGILVVEDGDVLFTTGVSPLDGGIITKNTSTIDRNIGSPSVSTPDTLCIRGPVIADGGLYVDNKVGFGTLPDSDFSQLPGFGGNGTSSVNLQSWREVYE